MSEVIYGDPNNFPDGITVPDDGDGDEFGLHAADVNPRSKG